MSDNIDYARLEVALLIQRNTSLENQLIRQSKSVLLAFILAFLSGLALGAVLHAILT